MNVEAIIKHNIATVHICAVNADQLSNIKHILKAALDDYAEDLPVPASVIRHESRKRHGGSYQTPGYYLRIYRLRADLTQQKLAEKINVKQSHLSEMEHNKRSIGKTLAKKLAQVLGCDYKQFL